MVLQRILSPKSLERVRFLLSPPRLRLMFGSAILWVSATSAPRQSPTTPTAAAPRNPRFKGLQSSMYGLRPISTRELVASAVLNGVFATLTLATFFPFMGFWHGKNWSMQQAKEDLKRGFTPALVLGGVMVPAKLITISRLVPTPCQIPRANLLGLVGSCSLSWIEQHRDADSWKQRFQKMEVQKSSKV